MGPTSGQRRASPAAGPAGCQLEALVLERLEAPAQVADFGQFEELSRLYSIEPPLVARTQAELQFDVYDGRRLRHSTGSLEDDDDELERTELELADPGHLQQPTGDQLLANGELGRQLGETQLAGQQQVAGGPRSSSRPARRRCARPRPAGLTWCRLLWFGRRPRTGHGRTPMGCCLAASDTMDELGLVSASSSGLELDRPSSALAPVDEAIKWALSPEPSDEQEQAELKSEALALLAALLASTGPAGSASGSTLAVGAQHGLGPVDSAAAGGPPLVVGAEPAGAAGGQVSVCLLDKRHLPRNIQLGSDALQGRRWARASARLVQVCRQLRQSNLRSLEASASKQPAKSTNGRSGVATKKPDKSKTSSSVRARLDKLAHQVSRRFWSQVADDLDEEREFPRGLFAAGSTKSWPKSRSNPRDLRLDHETMDELVELTKGSLNQLIDAQLLLRNKLTNQTSLGSNSHNNSNQNVCISNAAFAHLKPPDYERLLRNNFNLLKIWQNLEETKRLACFVCEPIRANLADLFWFNGRRAEWPPAQAFEDQLASRVGATAAGLGRLHPAGGSPMTLQHLASMGASQSANEASAGSGPCGGRSTLLVSPLVCLDANQVKRGLMQILEALNFLHVICKLVHRNLTPRNILIANNDNWKLSGLEFALRFESTTISESASIIAQETISVPPMLRYSSSSAGAPGTGSAGPSSALRRQRTLHQTKCQEFVRRHKCLLLQPDMDYLAPEIWRHSKCSHKSDIFSFGLIVAQTYDLCRHRPPISCRLMAENYEPQLKKLDERRKASLCQLVPAEMRASLMEMLDLEPNLRPSASHILQLLKRPIELCKVNEDSLRHLRASLGYLDGRLQAPAGATSNLHQQTAPGGQHQPRRPNSEAGQHQSRPSSASPPSHPAANLSNSSSANTNGQPIGAIHQQPPGLMNNPSGGPAGPELQARPPNGVGGAGRRSNYFRRVTSAAAQREPQRHRQARNLQLLNLFVRALDAMSLGAADQRQPQPAGGFRSQALTGPTGRPSFQQARQQFEHTLRLLKQVYKSGQLQHWQAAQPMPRCPIDSRLLMLLVALHQRLLDQVALMRLELPPVCPQLGATFGGPAPDRNYWPSASHRSLAEAEEQLYQLVSRHSLARLGESLADPLLKLDEFLLVFELVNDLVAFLGSKCRQSFGQRGKQLLNELTPVIGCPSLSSSDDEDLSVSMSTGAGAQANQASASLALGALGTGGRFSSASQQTIFAPTGGKSQANNSKMNNHHRHSDYDGYEPFSWHQQHQQATSNGPRQMNLPTSINITAPSPMGSMREVNRGHQADSSLGSPISPSGSMIRLNNQAAGQGNNNNNTNNNNGGVGGQHQHHQHQRYSVGNVSTSITINSAGPRRQAAGARYLVASDEDQLLAGLAGQQLGLRDGPGPADNYELDNGPEPGANELDGGQPEPKQDDKSRSQLIDELLKTINDDSFNEFIDFNNKSSAGRAHTSSNPNDLSAIELANSGRPRSAMDSTSSGAGGQSRPRTLNLGASNSSGQPAEGQRTATTFDNVIRRMSTNLVQNFNKMSAGTLGTCQQSAGPDSQAGLRREKSSASSYSGIGQYGGSTGATTTIEQANSLHVDNQIPARRHSDNTINVPRIQVALSSPQASGSRTNLNQRATHSASKLANKWKLSAKCNQREASDKLSPNLGGALSYMRRHSSGSASNNSQPGTSSSGHNSHSTSHNHNNYTEQNQSNGNVSNLLLNASPFKTRSSSNLGLDFLLSNRSMKRRYSAASMLGHQTQRKAENLLDAGMKSVQNMFG